MSSISKTGFKEPGQSLASPYSKITDAKNFQYKNPKSEPHLKLHGELATKKRSTAERLAIKAELEALGVGGRVAEQFSALRMAKKAPKVKCARITFCMLREGDEWRHEGECRVKRVKQGKWREPTTDEEWEDFMARELNKRNVSWSKNKGKKKVYFKREDRKTGLLPEGIIEIPHYVAKWFMKEDADAVRGFCRNLVDEHALEFGVQALGMAAHAEDVAACGDFHLHFWFPQDIEVSNPNFEAVEKYSDWQARMKNELTRQLIAAGRSDLTSSMKLHKEFFTGKGGQFPDSSEFPSGPEKVPIENIIHFMPPGDQCIG